MITKFTPRHYFWIVLIAFLAGCGIRPQDKTGSATATILTPISKVTLLPILPTYAPPRESPTPRAETLTALPTIPPTATSSLQPPSCTFPLAHKVVAESKPVNYTFSEPKVVLTVFGNLYSIIEWLPDNQQVLMTEDLISSRELESDKMLRQSIQLYNPETGESKVYATRYQTDAPPAWLAASNAIVYPAMNFLGRENDSNRIKFTRQVWVSHGDPQVVQLLADNLTQFPLAIKPDGSEMVFLSDRQLSKRDALLQPIPSVSFDPMDWDYLEKRNQMPVSYRMAWQPGTSLIFLYSDGSQLGGGDTFLLDANSGKICELNLDGWALRAVWSPNGQYLAVTRTQGEVPIKFSDLLILDSKTGHIYNAKVAPQEMIGNHYVDDLAWAPDNYHLLANGKVFLTRSTGSIDSNQSGLYLIDFVAGESARILPRNEFYANSAQNNLAWSSDGSKLLALCPTAEEERVCSISVHRTGQ